MPHLLSSIRSRPFTADVSSNRTATRHLYLVSEHCSHPKVRYLQNVILVQQEVLWLDVPVGDALGVKVLQAADKLFKEPLGLVLCHPNVRFNSVE